MRTVPDVEGLFQPWKRQSGTNSCLHSEEDFPLSEAERELIALPSRLGDLDISIPTCSANRQLESCAQVTASLIDLINSKAMDYPTGVQQKEMKAKMQSKTHEKAAEGTEAAKHHSQKVSKCSEAGK